MRRRTPTATRSSQPRGIRRLLATPAQEQGYPGQEQTYAGQDQWQSAPGIQAARPGQPRLKGEKGFVGSLFDFSFTSMVTPKIIKVLYALVTASTLLWALVFLLIAIHQYHVPGAIFTILIGDPLFVLLTLALCRVVLEASWSLSGCYEET